MSAQVAEWSSTAGRALHDLLRAQTAQVGPPVPPRALRIPFTLVHPLAEQLVPDVPDDGTARANVVQMPDPPVEEVQRVAWAKLAR